MAFDLLIQGGTIHDPASGRVENVDIGVTNGRIAALEPNLSTAAAETVIDAAGRLILPGLVDFHTHIYWGGTPLGVDPDALAAAGGVTTWVDAGSAGAGNVEGLVRHVVDRSPLTIRFFVHVSYVGLLPVGHTDLRFGELFDHRLADASACLRAIEEHREHVVGIKVRIGHSSTGPHGLDAMRIARSLGDYTGLPVMVHISTPPPLLTDVLPYLLEGDIVTHCYTPGLMGILDRHGNVLPAVHEARERGILFDVAHGAGSFSFEVAEAALAQGFTPDIISSDLHAYNVDGPTFDLVTTMMKFMAMGMSFDDVVARATSIPGGLLGSEPKGKIAVGADADLVIARYQREEVVLGDASGAIRNHDHRLLVDQTFARGALLEAVADAPQGKRKPGLPPIDERLTKPPTTAVQHD